jgi:hypothetical protein
MIISVPQRGHADEKSGSGSVVPQKDRSSRGSKPPPRSGDDKVFACGKDLRAEYPQGLGQVLRVFGDQGALEERLPFGQGGDDQGPLGVALGTGHADCGVGPFYGENLYRAGHIFALRFVFPVL